MLVVFGFNILGSNTPLSKFLVVLNATVALLYTLEALSSGDINYRESAHPFPKTLGIEVCIFFLRLYWFIVLSVLPMLIFFHG